MNVSRKFVDAIRCSAERQYRIAHKASLHPCTLSQLLNGIYPVKPNDARVLRVASVLGLDPALRRRLAISSAAGPGVILV